MHLHRRRSARTMAAGVVVVLAMTACSQGSATREPDENPEPGSTSEATESTADQVSITYMNFSANGGNEENLQRVVDAFESENPDVAVTVETFPYDDYFTVLQTAVAGGTEADVFELNYENLESFYWVHDLFEPGHTPFVLED